MSIQELKDATHTQTIAFVESYQIRAFEEIHLPNLKDRFAQMGEDAIDSILNEDSSSDLRRQEAFKKLLNLEKPKILRWLDTQYNFDDDMNDIEAVPHMRSHVAENILKALAKEMLPTEYSSPLWQYIPALKLTTRES